jgi:glycosyltransferase involved in cell wall biosynthesis
VTLITWKKNKKIKEIESKFKNITIKSISSGSTDDPASWGLIKRNIYWSWAILKAIYIAKRREDSIVHLIYLEYNEISSLFCNILYNRSIPYFCTLVVPYFEDSDNKLGVKKIYYDVNVKSVEFMMKKDMIDNLFVISDITNKRLSKIISKTVSDKIISIPDPVDDSGSNISMSEARKKIDIGEEHICFLFFGALKEHKGPGILIDAIKGLRVRSKVTIIFAGREEYIRKKDILKCKKNTHENVDIIYDLKFIPDTMVDIYFSASNFIVTPYKKEYKGMSGIVQDASAYRRPILTSNVGYIGDIVNENGLGVVVEPENPSKLADAIRYMSSLDNEVVEKLKNNLENYAKTHHWKKMPKKIRKAYRSSLTKDKLEIEKYLK